ncbi:hypothetical protein NC796_25050 [Aliifodinibius sp. S!AR15-10]|nr:hypothetical protein [Aliifodinibius sp. S!AR15-10]MDR8394438.1 hypothetical protein [Aliifodinibius sp. S!AR15-10]
MTGTFMNLTRTATLSSILVFVTSVLVFAASAVAQDGTIYPLEAPDEPNAIPLGTGGVEGQTAPETWFRQWGDPMARNISTATLTPFLPEPDKANGAAVIVAPGGGFRWLSMGNEGWEVAEALVERGIAAFVLKYRLRPTPESLDGFRESMNQTFAAADSSSTSQDEEPPSPPIH